MTVSECVMRAGHTDVSYTHSTKVDSAWYTEYYEWVRIREE
jgi:hypothetical protein